MVAMDPPVNPASIQSYAVVDFDIGALTVLWPKNATMSLGKDSSPQEGTMIAPVLVAAWSNLQLNEMDVGCSVGDGAYAVIIHLIQ